jgi:hypothetical protein
MAYWDHMHMNTGQKASLVLHGGLIALVLVFDLFEAPDSPMIPEVTEVSIISSQEFAELTQRRAPDPAPVSPQPDSIEAPAPVAPPEPEARPEPITPPPPAPPPDPAPVPEPVAEPEPPQAAVVAPTVTPDASLSPVQRPAERVAPEAAPTPDPDVAIAPRDQAAITPDADATIDAPEAQEATQREAAATETVTEVTRLSEDEPVQRTATAPEVSIAPRRRPARATPTPASAPAEEPAQIPVPESQGQGPSASDIESALAEALAAPEATLSQADSDMLRLNIEACWNVGILSTEALNVVVTIAFEMTPDARPIPNTIRLVGAEGGGVAAQQAAFDAGRQAIMQCGTQGYGLPQDLYDQWRFVEITFNPARMSTR